MKKITKIKDLVSRAGKARWHGKTKEEKQAHMIMVASKRWAGVSLADRVKQTKKACAAMRKARWPKKK